MAPQALALLDAYAKQLLSQVLAALPAAIRERLEHAVHRRGRRPQLVRGDRDEVELQLVEPDRLLVQLRALHGECDAFGDELEQLRVVARELPPPKPKV